MRYVTKYHEITGEWLVFDMGENFEVVGVHARKADAVAHARDLSETAERRRRWLRTPMLEAA